MNKNLVYFCIGLFILRVLFIPLFFPFGTPGFGIHAVLIALCLYLSSKWMLRMESPKKITSILIAAILVDFAFLILSKLMIYSDFPYYPRYLLMSVPLFFGLVLVNFKVIKNLSKPIDSPIKRLGFLLFILSILFMAFGIAGSKFYKWYPEYFWGDCYDFIVHSLSFDFDYSTSSLMFALGFYMMLVGLVMSYFYDLTIKQLLQWIFAGVNK